MVDRDEIRAEIDTPLAEEPPTQVGGHSGDRAGTDRGRTASGVRGYD